MGLSAMLHRGLMLRLDEAEYELWAIQQYRIALEQQLQQLVDQTPVEAHRTLREQGCDSDAAAVKLVDEEIDELVGRVYPRYFRSPFVLMLCAVFENIVITVTEAFRESKNVSLHLSDIRGDLLDRTLKYFECVLHRPLDSCGPGWERIKVLYAIRHCLIHAHGVVSVIQPDQQRHLLKLTRGLGGFSVVDGYILLSNDFLRESTALVIGWLRELIRQLTHELETQNSS